MRLNKVVVALADSGEVTAPEQEIYPETGGGVLKVLTEDLEARPLIVATHDGAFHPDEVLAFSSLIAYGFEVEIRRTRSPEVLATADIRVDVGGKYEPITGDYDHHQFTKDSPFYGKSAFGLIANALNLPLAIDVVEGFEQLVATVDARDTRKDYEAYRGNFWDTICDSLSELNHIDINSPFQREKFEKAVEFGVQILTAESPKALEKVVSRLHNAAEASRLEKEDVFETRWGDGEDVIIDGFRIRKLQQFYPLHLAIKNGYDGVIFSDLTEIKLYIQWVKQHTQGVWRTPEEHTEMQEKVDTHVKEVMEAGVLRFYTL
jgi:hypothetical protein